MQRSRLAVWWLAGTALVAGAAWSIVPRGVGDAPSSAESATSPARAARTSEGRALPPTVASETATSSPGSESAEASREAPTAGEPAPTAAPMEHEPTARIPGLRCDLKSNVDRPLRGDRVTMKLTLTAESDAVEDVPRASETWSLMALSVRFQSPPDVSVDAGKWYRLGDPTDGSCDGPGPLRTFTLAPGRSVSYAFPLHRARLLRPGREADQETLWAGRLTEAAGRIDLKAESFTADGRPTRSYGVASLEVGDVSADEASAVAWLRERRMFRWLGPYTGGRGIDGNALSAMQEFLAEFPRSRLADEARFTVVVGLVQAERFEEARSVVRRLAATATDAELRAAAVVEEAMICRRLSDTSGVLAALDVVPDPAAFPALADTVRSLRTWARER